MKSLILCFSVLAAAAALGCGGGNGGQTAQKNAEPADKAAAQEAQKQEQEPVKEDNPIVARSMAKDPGPANEMAIINTNHGEIKIRFFPEQAPLAVSNFKGLAAKGFYDGLIFHRIIPNFMMQGGDPTGTGSGGRSLWGGTFDDEFVPTLRFNRPGLLAMANRGPRTNSCQFFITEVPTPHLDGKHTIFGEVAEGFDIVQAIMKVETGAGNRPTTPVVMESVTIVTQ